MPSGTAAKRCASQPEQFWSRASAQTSGQRLAHIRCGVQTTPTQRACRCSWRQGPPPHPCCRRGTTAGLEPPDGRAALAGTAQSLGGSLRVVESRTAPTVGLPNRRAPRRRDDTAYCSACPKRGDSLRQSGCGRYAVRSGNQQRARPPRGQSSLICLSLDPAAQRGGTGPQSFAGDPRQMDCSPGCQLLASPRRGWRRRGASYYQPGK